MRRLTLLACLGLCAFAAGCFLPKYESCFEPSAEGTHLGSTYCADNRHGPPALAEFLIQSTPILVYAYPKPEEPTTIVLRMEVSLAEGQILSFRPEDLKAIDLETNQKFSVRPDHWSRRFLSTPEIHASQWPLEISGRPRLKGGLDRVAVFWTIASSGSKHFTAELPGFVIGGSTLTIRRSLLQKGPEFLLFPSLETADDSECVLRF